MIALFWPRESRRIEKRTPELEGRPALPPGQTTEHTKMAKETETQRYERVNRSPLLRQPDPQPPAGITRGVATVKTKRERGTPKDDGMIVVDWEERALIAGFIRVIRSNYWLSHFMKNLIRLDADSPYLVP